MLPLDMNSRIKKLFANRKNNILSVFYTAGFPQLGDTVPVGKYLEAAGADLIEIGIPFSDPIADGPVIQESNKVALDNGMSVKKLLEQIVELRKTVNLPILLMGYVNPVLQYGFDNFCRDASQAGIDGLILPDLPLDEYLTDFKTSAEKYDLHMTFLISPTTSEERIRRIDESTQGFMYVVSSSSTTGARGTLTSDQEMYFEKLKSMKLRNPFLIGFGISDHDTFHTACQYGSGAIIGSAFITLLKSSRDLPKDIDGFVKNIKG
jgi:tryptophan synthase alpha chain